MILSINILLYPENQLLFSYCRHVLLSRKNPVCINARYKSVSRANLPFSVEK